MVVMADLDDIVGVLHLDIPLKYRQQLKFKIEDWFAVKGADKGDFLSEKVHMAWIVIKYQANCKIADTPIRTVLDADPKEQGASKKQFAEKIREISKDLKDHSKGGFHHLEEVEKKIRDRRRKTNSHLQGTTISSPTKEKPSDLLSKTLTNKKKLDLGTKNASRSPSKHEFDKRITPDDLYGYTDKKGGSSAMPIANGDAVNARMAKEYAALQEELKNLKARCTALEQGQMTVDNIQLAKQLEKERAEQLKDNLKRQRELADQATQLAAERDAIAAERAELKRRADKQEAEMAERLDLVAEQEKRLAGKVSQIDRLEDEIQVKQQHVAKRESQVQSKEKEIKDREERIAEYAAELDELKDRLLQERARAAEEAGKRTMAKEDIVKELKELETKQKEFDKREKDLAKEMDKRERELSEREAKLKRDLENLEVRKTDIEDIKKTLEERSKRLTAQNEANEREAIELMAGKNKLAADIRQWMTDKKMMEKEIRDKKAEADAIQERLKEEEAEAEQREEELDEREDELDEKTEELRAREQQLLTNEEAFNYGKRRFVENVMASGGLDKLPPELKKLAETLGINVEELMAEEKRISDRKNQLERLKQENEENMQKVKAQQEERRMSRRASQAMTSNLLQKFGGGPEKEKDKAQEDLKEILKKRIMVKDPTNEDNIEYVRESYSR